jgi:NAD(P)-dependent dehydrogenase (short-subunit alcohol dehydrogenase family)
MRTNVYSTFYATRAVLSHMVKQKSGKIVSLASVAGWIGSNDGEAHYCAAKAAVMGYTRAVAAEVGKFGIRVNAIAPGVMLTARIKALAEQRGIPLSDTMAVGDGANDLDMLALAGLGVAFHAKPIVAARAQAQVMHADLRALLFAQGYRREEIADRP